MRRTPLLVELLRNHFFLLPYSFEKFLEVFHWSFVGNFFTKNSLKNHVFQKLHRLPGLQVPWLV